MTAAQRRNRPPVTLTLSPEAIARLDRIARARGQTRSAVIEQWIRKSPVAAEKDGE